jgi:transposase
VDVGGKNHPAWIWQDKSCTYVTVDASRGKTAINKMMSGGNPQTVLVNDCHASYFGMDVKSHQICTSHILRELTYLDELYEHQTRSKEMGAVIRDALALRKEVSGAIDCPSIKERLESLLCRELDDSLVKLKTLQKRLVKYKDYLFLFLENEKVPPDNNASERAARVFKIKLKVSGFFKSLEGANTFARLHSIADTTRKNGLSPFNSMIAIAHNH